jgi:dihydroorotate dehydrogenase
MDVVAARLAQRPLTLPIGINIGKNRDTELAQATSDYLAAFQRLAPLADYVAVNISSPNTPGLRQLHETHALHELLTALRDANQWQRPIFLKISPDESVAQLTQVVETALDAGITGIIATNTTVARPASLTSPLATETGGLSGAPLRDAALDTLRHVARLTDGRIPIISVGGISTAADVYTRLKAGASLVQLYTAMVYYGPAIAAHLSWALAGLMRRDGVSDIRHVIGIER